MKYKTAISLLIFFWMNIATTFAQDAILFSNDSIRIVESYENLIEDYSKKILNADVIKDILYFGVGHKTALTDDLVAYYTALYYLHNNEVGKALSVVNKSIDEGILSGDGDGDAKFLILKGDIHKSRNEFEKSIKAYLNAASRFQAKNEKLKEADVYRKVLSVYLLLGNYQQAYKYSKWAFNEYMMYPELDGHLGSLSTMIICENHLNLLDSAKVHIEYGMSFEPITSYTEGKILMNYAKSQWEYMNGNYHRAQPFAIISLKLAESHGREDLVVMNSILLMNIHNKLHEYNIALNFGSDALKHLENDVKSSMNYGLYDGLAISYAGLGDFKKAYVLKDYSDSLKVLDRKLRDKRSMDSLLVQFQTLSSENKILGQEAIIANQNHLLEKRRNFLMMGVFALSLLILFMVVIFILNNQRIKYIKKRQEAALIYAINDSEESERNKLASVLHDGLAAELTALKLELEQNPSTSERAFFMLNKAHHMSRNISHNLSTHFISEIGLIKALANLISSYNVNKSIHFYTNVEGVLSLDNKVETILYRSIQELVQNALKHAKATEINVQAILVDNVLTLSVEDDGVGIEEEKLSKSIGLNTVKQRIKLINGIFELESLPNRGTTIFIKLNIE